MTDGLKDRHRAAIIATIAANDRAERAVLFGSRATGTHSVSSDADIALFGDRLTLTDQARLAAALDEIPMAQSVDLLLYDSIQDRTLREHIRTHGVLWYARANPDRRVPLQDLCETIVDCPHSTPVWAPDGVVVLRSKNIRNGRLDLSQPSYTSEKDYGQRTKRATPRGGDLVITREAPMGEVCMIPAGLRCCLGQRMVLLRPCLAATDPRYLLYALQSEPVQQEIRSHDGTGSTVSNLRLSLLEDLRIPIHPLSEQRAIAHVLGTLDEKIELNRRMNATLEAMARALFKSWFVDFDPVRAKMEGRDTGLPKEITHMFPDRLVESALGEIPLGWDIGSLAQHFEAVKGVSYKGSGLGRGGIPLHNLNSVHEGGGYKYEGIKFYAGDYADRHLVRPGDVIVANTEQGHDRLLIGYAAIVPSFFGDHGICSHHVYRLRPRRNGKLSTPFLQLLLNSPMMHDLVGGYANGTTVNMLPIDAVQKPMLSVPPRVVIDTFDTLVLDTEHRREQIVRESRTLSVLRDSLLAKLVSGNLRVNAMAPTCGCPRRSASVGAHGV